MAVIEALATIDVLTADDATAALCLSREAGWNQSIEDWRLFLTRGSVFGLRDGEHTLVATAALLPSPPVTWISMVLVTQRWQRRGLAARLMDHCLAQARSRSLEPWLDATPAGAAVYRGIGFRETGFGLQRWRRKAVSPALAPSIAAGGIEALLASDRDAMRIDRDPVLRGLAGRERSTIAMRDSAIALVRDGDRARHIGPMFAPDEAAALTLLETIAASEAASLLIDIAADRAEVIRCVEHLGFAFERPFSRMTFGRAVIPAPGAALMAVAGPEFG